MIGVGRINQVYRLDELHGSDLCLSGTAEMALAGYVMNRQFHASELPLRLAAVSRCFRAETSRLSEERGIYRLPCHPSPALQDIQGSTNSPLQYRSSPETDASATPAPPLQEDCPAIILPQDQFDLLHPCPPPETGYLALTQEGSVREAFIASISSRRWRCSQSRTRLALTVCWRSSGRSRRKYLLDWDYTCRPWTCPRTNWGPRRTASTTWRHGYPGGTCSGKCRAEATVPTISPDALPSSTGLVGPLCRSMPTLSTGRPVPSREC
ncbi:uncharacterized protein LOC134527447 isoform X3 [Bacillus rossius redtenbacheri]|uniref:uncharacterized protein LOC134527447 isoform X3 n=1 Tax=Bacillus rossius redtenbacheri TaxID=93214 RepID=UPI002FDF0532